MTFTIALKLLISIYLFMTLIYSANTKISPLQANINNELSNVNYWLCANIRSLNIENKNSFVIFHPPQRHLTLNGKQLQQDFCIKYIGILIDTNLSWKPQIACIVKKIKRSVGILSKLRHYVNIDILTNVYYSLIHQFLTYGIIIWGNIYSTTLQPLYMLQKKAVRVMTFSSFDEHSTLLFRLLAIMKLSDLVTFQLIFILHFLCINFITSYYLPILIAFLIQYLVSITTVHEVQQINLITCLELKQTMEYLIFAFKDQRYGTLLGKI